MVTPLRSYDYPPSFISPGHSYSSRGVWPPPPLPPSSPAAGLEPYIGSGLNLLGPTDPYSSYVATLAPPPLPPVSCEISERLDALEKHRMQSMELLRERELDCEATVAKWAAKVEELEAKLRAEQATARRKLDEALREKEADVRDELRLEVQTVAESMKRTYQVENDQLRAENDRFRQEVDRLQAELRRKGAVSANLDKQQQDIDYLTVEKDRLLEDNRHLKGEIDHRERELRKIRALLRGDRGASQSFTADLTGEDSGFSRSMHDSSRSPRDSPRGNPKGRNGPSATERRGHMEKGIRRGKQDLFEVDLADY